MTADLQALKAHLMKYSVRTGDFTFKSGARGTYFIDGRQTTTRPDGMLLVADAMLERIPAETAAIGGLTWGADPVAIGVAAIGATRGRMLRAFSVRKEVKDHGEGSRIAGALQPGDKVVITEDTITRGTSVVDAARAVREFGADPILILGLIDRGGSCEKLAAEEGIPFACVLTAMDLGFEYEGGL